MCERRQSRTKATTILPASPFSSLLLSEQVALIGTRRTPGPGAIPNSKGHVRPHLCTCGAVNGDSVQEVQQRDVSSDRGPSAVFVGARIQSKEQRTPKTCFLYAVACRSPHLNSPFPQPHVPLPVMVPELCLARWRPLGRPRDRHTVHPERAILRECLVRRPDPRAEQI